MKCVYGTLTGFIDFPNKLAVSVYMQGCNLDCYFCHNKDVVYGRPRMTIKDVVNEVESLQQSFLSRQVGVVFTGGEPTANEGFEALVTALDWFPKSIHTNGLVLPDRSFDFEACVLSLKAGIDWHRIPKASYVRKMNEALQRYDDCAYKELRIVDVPELFADHHTLLGMLNVPDGWTIKWVQMSS